jgi:exonuclease SbcC
MSLKRLPDLMSIGGTNKEVKAEIVQRIGLSFEQFTRSVLLAQNEFSAFLKADDNERGELLETLTGITVYTDISRRAFERAKLELAALNRINDRLADQKPLSADERTALDEQSHAADLALAQFEVSKRELEAQLRWHESLAKARLSVEQAQLELAQSRAQHLAAAPRRTELERIEAVQSARSQLAECDRLTLELAKTQAVISEGDIALSRAELALQEAEASKLAAAQSLLDIEQNTVKLTPILNQARALDVQLETLMPHHIQSEAINHKLQIAVDDVLQSIENNDKNVNILSMVQQQTLHWLAEHAHLEMLVVNWSRWDTLLTQGGKLLQDQACVTADFSAAQQREAKLGGECDSADERLNNAAATVAQSEAGLLAAQHTLAGFDVPGRLARRLSAEARRELLSTAAQQWRALSANLSLQQNLLVEVESLKDVTRQSESALSVIDDALPLSNAALEQAERSLKMAEAACGASVERLRESLIDGEACSVCGATDHPYRRENLHLHAVLHGLQTEVKSCRDAVERARQQQTMHQTRLLDGRGRMAVIAEQMLSLNAAIQGAGQIILSDELDEIEPELRNAWFTGQQQQLLAQLQAISAEEGDERKSLAFRDQAQRAYDLALKQHAACQDVAASGGAALTGARAELTALGNKCADTTARLDSTLFQLDGVFDYQGWQDTWRSAPEAFHSKYRDLVAVWNTKRSARDEQRVQMSQAEIKQAALQDQFLRAKEEAARAANAYALSLADIDERQSARIALFGGRAVSEVQAELDAEMAAAKAVLDGQIRLTQQRVQAKTRLAEALDQAANQLKNLTLDAQNADDGLMIWINQFNLKNPENPLEAATLRTLLTRAQSWITDEKKYFQHIDLLIQNSNSILLERQAQCELIRQDCPTEETADTVQDALSRIEIERQSAQSAATTLQLSIAQDEARRARSASMLTALEGQEANWRRWAQLSELIGSADGKKFRNYAQQFTLDVLTGYANRHLEELSRRYRLERVADTLALMVVDQDMGDELRSVHSLSGGESFLVSLALALGLASLSSNRVRVESLFIDEGFGSLDPQTLSVAMDALDGLQALGRKVGVISHVQEMTERIATKILVRRQAGGKSCVEII